MTCKRYDIHWIDLNPTRGSEMRKRRPGVIVSLDVLNRSLETVVICPVTSQLHPDWRTRLPVKIARKPGEIAVDQIRAISRSRVGEKIGKLSERDAAALRRVLGEMYAEG